jgi:hypothetical protein
MRLSPQYIYGPPPGETIERPSGLRDTAFLTGDAALSIKKTTPYANLRAFMLANSLAVDAFRHKTFVTKRALCGAS